MSGGTTDSRFESIREFCSIREIIRLRFLLTRCLRNDIIITRLTFWREICF